MRTVSFGMTDVGRVREINEDYFLIRDNDNALTKKYGKLYIVCDGMGGHNAGEVASKTAAEEFAHIYFSDALEERDIAKRIKASIDHTNRKVYELSNSNPALQGMGTTIVGLVVTDDKAYAFNVGDSRCYLINKDKIEQLTEDHSLVNELVKANIMKKEDAKLSYKKNIITRAIGTDKKVEPFVREVALTPDTKFLLCTDGLSNMVNEDEIKHTLEDNKPKDALKELIDTANERGGPDNITAIEVEVKAKAKNKKVIIYTAALVIFLLLIGMIAVHSGGYKSIRIETNPSNATIYVNGKAYQNKCSVKLNKNSSASVIIKKKGFEEEKVNIFNKNGKVTYQITNGGDSASSSANSSTNSINSITGSNLTINLKKLVSFNLIDKTLSEELGHIEKVTGIVGITIDGKEYKDPNAVPLSLGKHNVKIDSENYYEVDKVINIAENTNSITINLEEIPLFTLNTEPEGARIEVFDINTNEFEYLKDRKGSLLTTPCKIDFNTVKGREVNLIKDIDNSYVYFKKLQLLNSSDIPEGKVQLEKYLKANIFSDTVNNVEFYDCLGNKLIKIDRSTFLIPDKESTQVCIKGKGIYEGYSVEIEKTFNLSRGQNSIKFVFKLLQFNGNNIKLTGSSSFRGFINGIIPVTLNKDISSFSIDTARIQTIEGESSGGFKYIYAKGGNP